MLVIRIAGAEEEQPDWPEWCSFCGCESDDYLITPWEHMRACRRCILDQIAFWGAVDNEKKQTGKFWTMASDLFGKPDAP